MGQAALRTDGTKLDSELSSATATRLHAWLAANDADMQASGVPPQLLQNFEPWFVGLTISIVEMTREGLDPKLGLDQHFAAAAKAAGKATAGLETGAQQIAFLDGMGKDDTLVVVGALHLLGSDGVVEKLRAKGYRVERICNACRGGTH
jgi:uncharacterized protein YbaP (TraB family)